MVGSDGKPLYLDDAAIASIKQIPHVAAATPYAQAYNLEGTITAGRNARFALCGFLLRDGHGNALLSAPGGQICTKTGTDFCYNNKR